LNIRCKGSTKREFMSKIGFARLSAGGSTIRRWAPRKPLREMKPWL